MSIRRRIFRSYMILIVLAILYLILSFSFRSFRLHMERDETDILEVQSRWAAMIVLMNETVSNWDDGDTYRRFVDESLLF
ncbi:MAG: hypothetical protein MI724_07550, partial [Spirochaetales bacterium]|nr:hypothetical protein [Spirochaetales bacterium]